MVTDPLFYRLFETSPETFFLLVGKSAEAARELAAKYRYEAIEFKETSHRTDGVFIPAGPAMPVYFVEVQFYYAANVYAGLMAKVFIYLKNHDPGQAFRAVVLFANRSLEPKELVPYQEMIEAGQIQPFYLEELDEPPDAPLCLSIVFLIRRSEADAPQRARELIARTKVEIGDEALRHDLIELIETVILYKLAHLTREEIQAMLQVHDIRQSRVWQEAKMEERHDTIVKLSAKGMTVAQIAALLDLDVEEVQRVLDERGAK